MGVKSTVSLTREEAEERAVLLLQSVQRKAVIATVAALSNSTLENLLETMNDEANDGEGFENYQISWRDE